MRLRLYLYPKEGAATLPKKFHHGLGSLIQSLANRAGRHLDSDPRLFCVSPPLWKEVETLNDTIRLKDGGSIIWGSAGTERLDRICNNREMDLLGNLCQIVRIEFIEEPLFQSTMVWRVPLFGGVVTTQKNKGTKKKLELTPVPFPNETRAALENNLRSKWLQFCRDFPKRAVLWSGEENPSVWIEGQRIEVSVPDKNLITISRVHQSEIKAWRGRISVTAPPAIQRLIWAAGLGQKTGCGFGFVELYRPKREPKVEVC